MKFRRYYFSIITLLVIPCFITAQDWLPVSFGEKYNYKRADVAIIHSTVWADSVHLIPGDSIYYLNRVFKHINEDYVIKNYPNFLQRELHITDDNYVFHSPETYVIPKEISVGEYWVFDTANNITAILSQIIADTILGQPDSIRVILLMADTDTVPDTLRMSKSHGITKFPDFQSPGVYFTLAGLEAEGLGLQMPMKPDFYDFQVGDSFEFRSFSRWESHYSTSETTTISSYMITDVQSNDSTMNYSERGLWKSYGYNSTGEPPWHIEYGTINQEVAINFYTSSWMNLYNGQANSGGGSYKPVSFVISELYGKPFKVQDLCIYCGTGDTLPNCTYQSVWQDGVIAGLGVVYSYAESWDSYYNTDTYKSELKAFKKEDEYYGIFSDLCGLLDPEIKAEMKILMSDTTITKNDTIVIAAPDYFDSYTWFNGSDSNAIIISSADYDTGTYQFTVEIGYYGCFQLDNINVTIKYPEPKAQFSWAEDGNTFYFTDQSPHPEFIIDRHWDFGDGANSTEVNPTHTYAETGVYRVCFTAINMVSDSSTFCDNVFASSSIPDPEKEASISIEYNAPGSIIIVNKSKKELDYCLQLVDQGGKLIKEEHNYGLSPGSRNPHDITDLSEGFYIVQVRTANEVVTRKIVR